MLSMKTRYALVALVRLAQDYGEGPVPISMIAEHEKIPAQFLEGILLELKKSGYVDSVRGKTGGYMLAKSPAEVAISSIVSLFQGSIGMMACVCPEKYRPCEFFKNEDECKLRKTFKYIHETISAILGNTTLKDLV
jgi:Rrf2 family protein